jgi:hypothetical protein
MKQIIRQLLAFLKNLFWTQPTAKPEPFKATEVIHLYDCIKYKGQWINLKKEEIPLFEAMARSDKRAMAMRFKKQVEKGHLQFIEIDGKMTCVKRKNYGIKESSSK